MSIAYQRRDLEIVDYQLFPLKMPNGGTHVLRGPKPKNLEKGNYVACLGAAYTIGCFVDKPYTILLQERLGISTLNLGIGGAGPEYFVGQRKLIKHYVNKSKLAIVLVMSGRSTSNSLFLSKGKPKYTRASDGKEINATEAYKDLLENYEKDYVMKIVQETRDNWVLAYEKLFSMIEVPKIIFWFSRRKPEYVENYSDWQSLFGAFPHLVNSQMIEEITAFADEYVECVTWTGMPQLLISRFFNRPIKINNTDGVGKDGYNEYHPSPQMHLEAASALEPVCRKYLN